MAGTCTATGRSTTARARRGHRAGIHLSRWVGLGAAGGHTRINSVHHQGVRRLGRDLVIEARSVPDGVVEAVRFEGRVNGRTPFAYGVQWHPEFMFANPAPAQMDPTMILRAFVDEVRLRRDGSPPP